VVPSARIMRSNIQAGLKDGGAAVGESVRLARVRGAFVVLQAAFAVILLAGAGLMVHTLKRLQDVNLGFDSSWRVKVRLNFPNGYVTGQDARLALLQRLQDHLRHVPGVASVSYSSDIVMAGYDPGGTNVYLADGTTTKVTLGFVPGDFQEPAGMVLKRGRWLNPSTKVEVVINESLARLRFGKDDPIGQVLKPEGVPLKGRGGWNVVGVVADVRETVRASPGNQVFGPGTWFSPAMTTFIVHMARDPGDGASGVFRRAVYQFDPKIVTADVTSMVEARDQQLYFERFAMSVLKVLSVIAMLLTVVGLFSVLAYTVDRRMGE